MDNIKLRSYLIGYHSNIEKLFILWILKKITLFFIFQIYYQKLKTSIKIIIKYELIKKFKTISKIINVSFLL